MNLEPACETQHGAFIAAAQEETARLSYGRALSATEREALHLRLHAAFTAARSHVRVASGPAGAHSGYYWMEERDDGIAFVLDFHVAASARRRGVGRQLWHGLVAHALALKLREIRLAVADNNAPARAFFAWAGLVKADEEIREGRRWLELRMALTRPVIG
jgi:ribosomal protein S18 acetylase RimI-like enzyme